VKPPGRPLRRPVSEDRFKTGPIATHHSGNYIKFGKVNRAEAWCPMKLHDCGCGGIPIVTYRIDRQNEFSIACPICGNATSEFEILKDAVNDWNLWMTASRWFVAETAE
jgi:hypothetical protein